MFLGLNLTFLILPGSHCVKLDLDGTSSHLVSCRRSDGDKHLKLCEAVCLVVFEKVYLCPAAPPYLAWWSVYRRTKAESFQFESSPGHLLFFMTVETSFMCRLFRLYWFVEPLVGRRVALFKQCEGLLSIFSCRAGRLQGRIIHLGLLLTSSSSSAGKRTSERRQLMETCEGLL